VAAAVSLAASERRELGRRWELRGLVYVSHAEGRSPVDTVVALDTAAARETAARAARWRRGRSPAPSIDPIARFTLAQLECPAAMLAADTAQAARSSLDSICNRR